MAPSVLQRVVRSGLVAALGLVAAAGPGWASLVTFAGNLGDVANPALVASDLGAPLFTDDGAIANNVALHALHVVVAGNVSFASTGYPAGGIDPYLSVFSGADQATAPLVASNYPHAISVGGDFVITEALAAGDYWVAIGVFENLSFAENLASGVLADGFIGLGSAGFLGDGSYTLSITLPDDGGSHPVPEPGGASLALLALLAAWRGARPSRP